MNSADLSHPRHLTLAALDLAGLPLDGLGDAFLTCTPEDDFLLEFGMPGGADLVLCFDAAADHFEMRLRLPAHGDDVWRMALALELNRSLEPHLRIQRDGTLGRTEMMACLTGQGLQAQDLALAVLDLCELQQRFEQALPVQAGAVPVPPWLGLRA